MHVTLQLSYGAPEQRRHLGLQFKRVHLAATCPCSVQRERAEVRAHIQNQGQALRILPIDVGGMLVRCAVRCVQLLAVASRVVKDPVLVDIVEPSEAVEPVGHVVVDHR